MLIIKDINVEFCFYEYYIFKELILNKFELFMYIFCIKYG